MKYCARLGIVVPLLLALLLLPAPAALADDDVKENKYTKALKEGKVHLNLRYRYENVEDDAVASGKDARASTLRTTLGYESQPVHGVSLFLEAENVARIGNDLYNNAGAGSLNNGVGDRPVVTDPALTEVNQAMIRYKIGDTGLRAGRQEIVRGDSRFVGNVGWRQNHQSFDAFNITDESLDRVVFNYAYVDNVNRIFGDNKEMGSHLFDAAIKLGGGKLTAYGYLLDYDNPADFGLSTSTLGLEYAAKRPIDDFVLLYELEYADQGDYADNPGNVAAGYAHVMVGAGCSFGTVKLGYEMLEGSPADGQFQTPLATLHKFNGWADKFLGTPTNGLEDFYLHVGGEHESLTWAAIYHDFGPTEGSGDYGSEVDLLLTWKAPWGEVLGFKGAFYSSDGFAEDTTKLMVWAAWGF